MNEKEKAERSSYPRTCRSTGTRGHAPPACRRARLKLHVYVYTVYGHELLDTTRAGKRVLRGRAGARMAAEATTELAAVARTSSLDAGGRSLEEAVQTGALRLVPSPLNDKNCR
jgi:hypothetical protein